MQILHHIYEDIKVPLLKHVMYERVIDNKMAKMDPEGSGLTKLRDKIIEAAEKQPYWGEERPIKWLALADNLDKKREDLLKRHEEPMIALSDMKSIARNTGVQDAEIDTFLTLHHRLGDLVYFNDDHLCDTVILCPQWLGNVFRCVFEMYLVEVK